MQRFLSLICLCVVMALAACAPAPSEAPADPLALLRESAEKIRAADTFRLYVAQSGAPAVFYIYLDEAQTQLAEIQYRFARGQYVAPDTLQATARVIVLGGLPIDAEIFSQSDAQWYRLPPTVQNWIKGDFAPGFNPATLIADDSGFQAALTALKELEWVETTTLDDGQPVQHLRGIADGQAVSALVVGLLRPEGDVPVDVFINRDTRYPARLVLTLPETANEANPVPTTWTIDVYDINAAPELTPPPGAGDAADAAQEGGE